MTAAHKLWTDEHQRQLRHARLDAGVSDVAFARDNAIALRHLRQLEEGGSSAFYSESIKYDMGAKLLKRLGVELHNVAEPVDAPVDDAPKAASVSSAPRHHAQLQGEPRESPAHTITSPTRMPYLVLSLVGLGLIGAGISLIPAIRSPGAVSEVVQSAKAPAAPAVESSIATPSSTDHGNPARAAMVPIRLTEGGAPTEPVVATQAVLAESCEQAGTPQTIMPSQPSKAGDYVYLTALGDVSVCVRDAAGQITRKSLQAGQSFNIPGRQPFEVTADQLDQLRVFFQGQRIWFQAGAHRLRLTAATASD